MPLQVFTRVRDGALPITRVKGGIDARCPSAPGVSYRLDGFWDVSTSTTEIGKELNMRSKNSDSSHYYWVAFGYTGSGKTYTVYGLLRWLLANLVTDGQDTYMTAYQTYNDAVYDMLNRNARLRVYKTSVLIVREREKRRITSRKVADSVVLQLERNRAQAPTTMNAGSSRSHAVIEVSCGGKTWTLVDMAGQESGRSAAQNNAHLRQECASINLDMLALKECIRARKGRNGHVPYRSSLLTLALKPMFEPHTFTAFICTIALCHPSHFRNDSLSYAAALRSSELEAKGCHQSNKEQLVFQRFTEYLERGREIARNEVEIWTAMKNGDFSMKDRIDQLVEARTAAGKHFLRQKSIVSAPSSQVRGRRRIRKGPEPVRCRRQIRIS